MKKPILKISIVLALIIVCASSAISQIQPSSTVTTDQTVSFLLDQNEKARDLIAAQEKRIADLETEIAAEKENSQSVTRSYDSAKREIDSLRAANEALHKVIVLNEQTIAALQADRDHWKDKAHKEKMGKYKAYIVAAGVIALKFLIP